MTIRVVLGARSGAQAWNRRADVREAQIRA
jgi:hypothetical protein